MKIAHVEASNIVPMMVNQRLSEKELNVREERIEKILESLSLQGIES